MTKAYQGGLQLRDLLTSTRLLQRAASLLGDANKEDEDARWYAEAAARLR